MHPIDTVHQSLLVGADVLRQTADHCSPSVAAAATLIANAFRAGNKLLLCGNGGSAADCQHMAAEFVSRLTRDFERPALPAIALTTDSSFLTAYANDCGYEGVFARQVEALGQRGDVLLGISTSGSSANVLRAFAVGRERGLGLIALTGHKGTPGNVADVTIAVPSDVTAHIQVTHLAIEHAICALVERALFTPGDAR